MSNYLTLFLTGQNACLIFTLLGHPSPTFLILDLYKDLIFFILQKDLLNKKATLVFLSTSRVKIVDKVLFSETQFLGPSYQINILNLF